MNFPDLPVNQALPQLAQALRAGHAVLTAPPGSGKTTIVPLALLDQPWLAGQRILMLEPRRPAARMAARRLAQLAGGEVGGLVGYQVRLDRRIGPDTRIEVITEGILTRRLQNDPALEGVGLLIFDEFHERNLQADLGLALALDACAGLREDLRLLPMSATLDAAPLCRLLDAQHVEAQGRQYPVAVHYLDPQDRREPLQAMPGLVRRALAEEQGDILVFLPGRAEIERLAQELQQPCAETGVQLQRLYGDLPAAEQDRVLLPPDKARRVILSTDLAESSLTIEGVSAVVDSGLARKPRFDPNSGMTRLQREPISQASAEQRAGRAGRLGPGRCYRAWGEARQARLLPESPPEIAISDLSPLVLELALWGVTDPAALAWLDAPPPAHWQQACELLQQLDALNPDGTLTSTGRSMAQLGVEPRLARLMGAAHNADEAALASDLAALLSERDLLADGRQRGVDLELRLHALRDGNGAERRRLQVVRQLASSLRRQLPQPQGDGDGNGKARSAAQLLALAYPDRIALARGGRGRFLLANGRGAVVDESDALAGADCLVVAQLDAGQREGRIWSALALDREQLRAVLGEHIQTQEELAWDAQRERVSARRVERLGALLLSERPADSVDPAAAQALLLEQVARRWPHALTWSEPALQLRARLQRMAALDPDGGWPDVTDEALRADLAGWLGPWLEGCQRLSEVARLDLVECLSGRLDWNRRQQLDAWLPSHFETPAGSRRAIDYRTDGDPQLSVPLQEMFGQAQTPRLAQGRQPLVLTLLNPAGRPVALTADLASFWQQAYREVRKELRGRYPKHDWPEDPAAAAARRGTGRPRRS